MHALFVAPLPFLEVWGQIVPIDEARQGKNDKQANDDRIELPVLLVDLTHELLLQTKGGQEEYD